MMEDMSGKFCFGVSTFTLTWLCSAGTQPGKSESDYSENEQGWSFGCKEETYLMILTHRAFILKRLEVERQTGISSVQLAGGLQEI